MERRRAVNGGENDVHSKKARRRYCWTQRAGECARVKRATNRRERREGRDAVRRADRED